MPGVAAPLRRAEDERVTLMAARLPTSSVVPGIADTALQEHTEKTRRPLH